MKQAQYKVSATSDNQYSTDFESFVCTKKALDQFLKLIKESFNKEKEPEHSMKVHKNKIEFDDCGNVITLKWEKHKEPVVITEVKEIFNFGFSCSGHDSTYLAVDMITEPE